VNRRMTFLIGVSSVAGFTALWHGPLGAGERMVRHIESQARQQLDHDEMFQVQARLQRSPLSRRLILSGPADDFQRQELVRRLDSVPGVLDVQWDAASLPQEAKEAR
jgi:hypothetical protein